MRKMLIVLGLMAMASRANADNTVTGTWLRGRCESQDGFCYGYLLGINSAVRTVGMPGLDCPVAATAETLRLTYLKWTARNPKLLTEEASLAALATFASEGLCSYRTPDVKG